jgi:ribosome-associated protein
VARTIPDVSDILLPRGVSVPEAELVVRASRAGGPGGQGVNTTSSKVELRWDVTASTALDEAQRRLVLERLAPRLTDDGVLILQGSEHRSQLRNREAVLARFRALVGEALIPTPVRRRTRPTRASKVRRLEAKRRRAVVKESRKPPERS